MPPVLGLIVDLQAYLPVNAFPCIHSHWGWLWLGLQYGTIHNTGNSAADLNMEEFMRTSLLWILGFTLIGLSLWGADFSGAAEGKGAGPDRAIAVLHSTEGNNVRGTVTFEKKDKGIGVLAEIKGLTGGKHGFHIHEYGDCSAADATTAGGHFNPEKMPHGGPRSEKRHVGDLGNIEADGDGNARLEMVDPKLAFQGSHSIIGRSVIVHAKPDDFTTQPTGDAGDRWACGVIGFAK